MSGRVHIETGHVFDLFGEFGIVGALERPQTMRLKVMGVPQTLDGAKRDADGLGHRAACPMGGFARWFRAGERQHFGDDAGRKRSPARLARLVAQETSDSFLPVSLLPAPNSWAADAGLLGDLQDRQALGRKENNPRPLDMFERTTTVAGDHERLLAIVSHQNDIDGFGACHQTRTSG